jgi:hypothetical protein
MMIMTICVVVIIIIIIIKAVVITDTCLLLLRRGADKSLARPGRKQATGTKLGIIQHTPHEAQ